MSLRVFISHATQDTAFAQRLAADLRRAGADIWLDATHMGPGIFPERIDGALHSCNVLVLVLTPRALTSQWVTHEMYAAIARSKQQTTGHNLMRDPVVVLAQPTPVEDIPPLWNAYNRIDATASYDDALPAIVHALGLALLPPAPTVAPAAKPPTAKPPAAKPVVAPGTPPQVTPTGSATSTLSRRTLLLGASALAVTATSIGVVLKLASSHTVAPGDTHKRWSFQTGNGVASSPTVADGLVYVGSGDANVYALDASTGAKRWSFKTGGGVESSPAVANGLVYVGSYDQNVYALDASTGAKRWSFKTGGWVLSSPVVANGLVYVSSSDQNVYALDA